MNWFDILKEQRQIARNVQSFKPIQLDKPIKLNKPPKDTCYEKLVEYLNSKFELIFPAQTSDNSFGFGEYRGEGNFQGDLYFNKDIHDNLYCLIRQQVDEFITNIDRFDNQAPPTGLRMHGLRFNQHKHFKNEKAKKPHLIGLNVLTGDDSSLKTILWISSYRPEVKPEEENS